MDEKKVVMVDSPEAASVQTVTGWVSRTGFFCGNDEQLARSMGSTHRPCESCGISIKKGYIRCPDCQKKREREQYEKLPKQEWDGQTPLVIFNSDRYFWSLEEAEDWAEEQGISLKDLPLVFCDPIYYVEIDPQDYYESDLPDDQEVAPEIQQAFDRLNETIRNYRKPLAWEQGRIALLVKDQDVESPAVP